ncbi:MAG TPA: CGNR zinc finger domain-containing protein [Nitrososphaerales archaeon]|nr:CGNR zinc finger domain-containing protein [Nitrososphaerales archaeon]
MVVRLKYMNRSGSMMESGRDLSRETNLELCLDFANTIDWRTSNHPENRLRTYSDLLKWSQRHDLVNAQTARYLARQADELRNRAEEVVEDANQLREAIFRLFSATAHEKKPEQKDTEILNHHLARSLSKTKLSVDGGSFVWGWEDGQSLDMVLWPVARSAANLLTSDKLSRVKECANEEEGCGSLFLDCSVNKCRRWCSMDSCGNRMKFKKYYDRHLRVKQA